MVAGGLYAGAGLLTTYSLGRGFWRAIRYGSPRTVVARVQRTSSSRIPIAIKRQDLAFSKLDVGADGGIAFDLHHDGGIVRVEGPEARTAARQLLPRINRGGGTRDEIDRAIRRLEHAGDAERLLGDLARRGPGLTRVIEPKELKEFHHRDEARGGSGLLAPPSSVGLAMEMALNEEEERRVLEGELAELEEAWKEAEEVGAIADSLLLPAPIEQALARLKRITQE